MPENQTFFERLQYAKDRISSRLRWKTIADAVGISKTNFSRYKNENYYPSPVTLLKIARYLGVDAAWLAGNEIKLPDDNIELLIMMFESLEAEDKEKVFSMTSNFFYKTYDDPCLDAKEDI